VYLVGLPVLGIKSLVLYALNDTGKR
jgi:hypothetical protein